MSEKHVLLLYNFPQCSLLKEEITSNLDKNMFAIKTCDNILKLVDEIREDPTAQILIFSDSYEYYEQLEKDLVKLKDDTNVFFKGTLIFPELDRPEQRPLMKLGINKFFLPEDHPVDIAEHFINIYKINDPIKDDKIVISASRPQNSDAVKEVELTIKEDHEFYDEIKANILENTDAKNIKLESGSLDVSMKTAEFPNVQCSLEDFSNQDIEVEILSIYTPQVNENIDVKVIFAYDRCKVELLLTGQVTNCYDSLKEKSIISIKLSEDESESLNNFMTLYQKRQKSIDEFMTLARGK